VLGGLLPFPCLALARAALAKDEPKVRELDAALQSLWELFQEHGSVRVVYAAANMLDLTHAQPPRPILPLGDAERERIREALDRVEGASAGAPAIAAQC
jgi:4-hydroxy-tetrahydrodipicolinate synthase